MTKSERKKIARDIISRYAVGGHFMREDVIRFGELCGFQFQFIQRCEPLRGAGLSIHVQCNDEGHTGRWSWVKSIDGYSERKNTLQAMRAAICRGTFGRVEKRCCAICGAMRNLTVDHKSLSFARIAAKFIEKHGTPRLVNKGSGWQLRDEGQFILLHDTLADYQVLCVSCNARKGSAS